MKYYITVIIFAVFLLLAGVALSVGGSIWYTRTDIQHECSALNLILSEPKPKPVNPQTSQSRNFSYNFYQDIVLWAKSDGC